MLKLRTTVAACLALSAIVGIVACSSQLAKSGGDAKTSSSPSVAGKTADPATTTPLPSVKEPAATSQIQTTGMPGSPTTLPAGAQEVLPRPEQPFKGEIGRTTKESVKDFPKMVEAPKGAPNILIILTDDVGFGASSTFGGPIPTPTMDRLAKNGLRYNQFHTTALCSPTRAALLTGRNHQSVGMGNITEFATGYPGYTSIIPKSAGTIGNILIDNGYNTAWFGKHHLVPEWMQGPGGPFDQWAGGL